MPKIFVGFNADEMFIGPRPSPEEVSLAQFQTLLENSQWHSRYSPKDEIHGKFLKEKTGIALPNGSPRLMYLSAGDVYVEIKILAENIRFFRYHMPTTSI